MDELVSELRKFRFNAIVHITKVADWKFERPKLFNTVGGFN